MKFAVIKTGGKQYVVHENDEIVVDKMAGEAKKEIEVETLAAGDGAKGEITLGKPSLDKKVKAVVLETLKGDKIRVARFKAKARYRKVKGFRPMLTKIKIISI